MRTATGSRNSEKESMMRAVKMPRGKGELGEFPADRTFMQRAIVCAKRVIVTVDK
jgi:hypothetical protein